jgi:hypothetical protein
MVMATPKKPAGTTRKKTTKRGPTKAAALKALGLTQEDLDTLKTLVELREQNEKTLEFKTLDLDDEPTRDALASEINVRLTEDAEKAFSPQPEADIRKESTPPTEQKFYARNLRNADASIRLTRQEGKKRRLEFKPRGERGDIQPLEKDDLNDVALLDNVGLLVEIITAAEAKDIISKQVVNRQQQVHPAMAMLRNALGEEYAQTEVPVVHDGSYTIAHLNPVGGEAGNLPDQGRGVDWNAIHQGQAPVPERPRSIGGNPAIISDGFARNDSKAATDALARKKSLEGPGATGITKVIVDPVQRT